MSSNVTKVEEETLREITERGVKQGAVKSTVDKSLDRFTVPVAEQLQNILHKLHPDAGITDKAVKGAVDLLVMNGAAEIVSHSSAVTTKIPGLKGFDKEKVDMLGRWLRGYSGEQAGTKVSDTAFAIAPVLANMMNNPGLKDILANMAPAVAQLPEANTGDDLDGDIQLSEDEEEGDNG